MAVDDKLLCPPGEKADREIANQKTVIEYIADFVQKGRKRVTEEVVSEVHRLTIEGIYPCAGNYRDALTHIEITDPDHKPTHPALVRSHVRDMLEELQRTDTNPVKKAAYVLWRVNAIHPFNGGNGRVARSLAYLVMVIEVAPVFAGRPLPAILKDQKPAYIAGLKAADKGDLGPLENLVLEAFQTQIAEISLAPPHH